MISKLTIVAGFKEEKSYLKDVFFTRPFRIAGVGQYKTDSDLYLMVMSSSPGLLDKDHYDIFLKVESNSRLLLQSQAYQRLYNMQAGATQKVTIMLEPGSAFSYAPHPIVPHQNSKFKSHTVAYLQENCQLLLSEIITCGRKLSGEVFRFTYFQSLTEIFYQQKLVLKDNILLQPQQLPLNTIGRSEGYTHQGSLIYISTGKEPTNSYLEQIRQLLEEEINVSFGISEIATNGFVLRVLGNGGEQLYNCFKRVQERLWYYKPIYQTNTPVQFKTLPVCQQI